MISPLSSSLSVLAVYGGTTRVASPSRSGGMVPSRAQLPAPGVSASSSGEADGRGGYARPLGRGELGGSAASAALSPDAQRQLDKLKATDRQVRAHEQAHMAAGGALVRGGASYSYQKGPDGQLYAVGGEVSIDVSPGRTPEETISKAAQIRAAALAPADPSGQDRNVAAGAARLEAEARAELASRASPGQGSGAGSGPGADSIGSSRERSAAATSDVAAISRRLQSVYGGDAEARQAGRGAIDFYA